MLGLYAEHMTMEMVPKDLGQRIAEAARLAVLLHLQEATELTGEIGGAEIDPDAIMLARSVVMPREDVEGEAA
jgi:hypothetical protein